MSSDSSIETERNRKELLKARLVQYWNSQEKDRNVVLDEVAASLAVRGKVASFLPEGGRILDVACGTTANYEWFAPRGKYFGTDITLGYLRLAAKQEKRLICADAEKLPFGDSVFDAATLTFALEHAVNPVGILREMCRVVGEKGRVILLCPTWDLPFWYPNALASRSKKTGWHLQYALLRLGGQLSGWFLGRLPFVIVNEPDAFSREFEADADAVYVVWSYEVIRQLQRWGFRLIHSEVDDRLWGTSWAVRFLKRLLHLLPIYKLAGSTVLLVFEREGPAGG